ncbi:MAG: peptidase inhibitor family I36 protein [Acidobacteria bacterium]|nr:peptidase inhibitor family I36 protein [Acidobacteriota bacterium]
MNPLNTIFKLTCLVCLCILAGGLCNALFAQGKVILYKDKNFKGTVREITANVANLSLSPWYFHDQASSLKLEGVTSIAVYDLANFGGTCETITHDMANLGDSLIGNDKITSIKINADCGTGPAVILYEKSNYGGKMLKVTRDVADLSGSAYKFNDITSSLKLDGATSVALYDHANYLGNCQVFNTNTGNLGGTNIEHDTVSSVRINGDCSFGGSYAMLYEDQNYGGRSVRVTDSMADLDLSKFNDKLSSLKLFNLQSVAIYEHKSYMGKCQTIRNPNVADLKESAVKNDKASSIKLNKQCEDFVKLEIKNKGGFVIRFRFENGYPDYEQRDLAALKSHTFSLRANESVHVIVYVIYIGDNIVNTYEICNYEVPMDRNTKIETLGTLFNPHCELKYEY